MGEWLTISGYLLGGLCAFGLIYFVALSMSRGRDVIQRERDIQFWRDKQAETFDSLTALRARIVRRHLYGITVADWGSEFDGENGNLHRWRWSVSDADLDLKDLWFEKKPLSSYLMLGNEPTAEQAWFAAVQWCEQQDHPYALARVMEDET